jgi:hypothetical protein
MAAPHVAGVASIVWATNPFLTNTQVRSILEQQVLDLGTPGWDQYFGSGMCHAWKSFYNACMQLSINITANGDTTICNGSTVTLNAPFNENVTYQWRNNGVDIIGETSNSLIVSNQGNYTLKIKTLGCQTSSNSLNIDVIDVPTQPSAISGPTLLCTGQSNISYTINPILNTNSYVWSLPNGFSGSSSTNSIIVNSSAIPTVGNISIKAVNSCGTGPQTILPISVNQTPVRPVISSPNGTILCQGSSINLSSNSNIGNQWYYNATIISGANNSIYNTTVGGTFTVVTSLNGCSSSPSNPITISLIQIPQQPNITISGNNNPCRGDQISLSSSSSSGNQWFLNNSQIPNAISRTYIPTLSGDYSVVSSLSGCSSSPSSPVTITITESPTTPSISWNGSQFSTTATGVTYQWYLNGNAISGATSANYTPTSIGVYKVVVTSNGCSTSSNNYTLVVTGINPSFSASPYQAEIFPNPAKNDFVVKFSETPNVTLEMQLINNLGVHLRKIRTKNKLTSVKVNDLPSGVYFIKIIGGAYDQVRKIEVIK